MNNTITLRYIGLSLIFVLITASGFSQVVNIPDANFKAALVADTTINTNRDGEIQVSEAEAAQTVNVSSKNIADLTGIASFKNLVSLDCSNNQLTSLSTESNFQLSTLFCQNNRLTFLEIRKITDCNEFFQQFDARGNPDLTCIEVFQIRYRRCSLSSEAEDISKKIVTSQFFK